ncbi:hypothetical protein TorRG33x02_129030 [Trema orientale]|uniref:Uncharacterized protein n=1 Tax=Trema orientale TaxID=63057 RepID=A0A2P5F0N3_TREOI|nr:hypothetical protein TorRG33x02_129030 [Trema orientale]
MNKLHMHTLTHKFKPNGSRVIYWEQWVSERARESEIGFENPKKCRRRRIRIWRRGFWDLHILGFSFLTPHPPTQEQTRPHTHTHKHTHSLSLWSLSPPSFLSRSLSISVAVTPSLAVSLDLHRCRPLSLAVFLDLHRPLVALSLLGRAQAQAQADPSPAFLSAVSELRHPLVALSLLGRAQAEGPPPARAPLPSRPNSALSAKHSSLRVGIDSRTRTEGRVKKTSERKLKWRV